ncbi:MAG TPA: hypothetical protein IAA01_08340, partial [Candidatus Fournierella excrementavium]|nr:hypothetical protein [Candidatus Fournierella excrementavium]
MELYNDQVKGQTRCSSAKVKGRDFRRFLQNIKYFAQPVEKPALAIRPEQVFCLKTRRQEEKAVKCQAHFRAIWTVCRH